MLLLTLLLIRGTKESAFVNGLIVILKTTIVLLFIGIGWGFINPGQPHAIDSGADDICDSAGHHAPLRRNPRYSRRSRSRLLCLHRLRRGFDGRAGSEKSEARHADRHSWFAVICTILYVLFAWVLSGVATVQDFRSVGREASVAFAITKYMHGYEWLSKSVTIAILAGFSSVILVLLLGQSRVFYSMSRDGLVPRIFSDVHPRFRTPYKSNMLFFVFTGLIAAFVPADVTGEMTSIGTLFAFILVCAGIWILRVRRPDLERGFKVPMVPVVCTLGMITCGAMIYGLGWTNWMRLIVWLADRDRHLFCLREEPQPTQRPAAGNARGDKPA